MSGFTPFDIAPPTFDMTPPSIPLGMPSFTAGDVIPSFQYDFSPPSLNLGGDSSAVDGSSFDWNPDNAIKLVQAGVTAYGQIHTINRGGYQPAPATPPPPVSSTYSGSGAPPDNYPPDTYPPDTGAAPPAAGFDWSQLGNLSTPYPYALALAALVLAGVFAGGRRSRGR